jgi:hypothetical protein
MFYDGSKMTCRSTYKSLSTHYYAYDYTGNKPRKIQRTCQLVCKLNGTLRCFCQIVVITYVLKIWRKIMVRSKLCGWHL